MSISNTTRVVNVSGANTHTLAPRSGLCFARRRVLTEFLSFLIMVPLAILAWRGIGAIFGARDPNSNLHAVIQAIT